MTDVLLVNLPSTFRLVTSEFQDHIGIGYLAAVLRENGLTVEMLDASLLRLSPRQVAEIIGGKKFKVLGLSQMNKGQNSSRIIEAVRRQHSDAHIVLGGHYPTFWYDELLKANQGLDSIVRGEGDYTLLELAKAVLAKDDWTKTPGLVYQDGDKIVANHCRPLIKELDSLPFPARDTVPEILKRSGEVVVATSRGCYAACSFCSIPLFYGISPGPKWRARSADNIVKEIEHLVERWNLKRIFFIDEMFIGPRSIGRKRAYEIGQKILDSGVNITFRIECRADDVEEELFAFLKKAGLREVFLGIESGIQKELNNFNKKISIEQNKKSVDILRKLKIRPQLGFIMFTPYTTVDDVINNVKFIRAICGSLKEQREMMALPFGAVEVYKGTPLEKTLREEGKLKDIYLDRGYRYSFSSFSVKMLYNLTTAGQRISIGVRRKLAG